MFHHFLREDMPIFIHCYDYPIPSDRGYSLIGFTLAGPWIKPTLNELKFSGEQQKKICKFMINEYADMLCQLSESNIGLTFVDTRNTINNDEWDNEIHPKESGFGKIANKIKDAIYNKIVQ